MKHTKGPWTADGAHVFRSGGANGIDVNYDEAQDAYHPNSAEIAIQDARLIAAAPELLEAIQQLAELYKFRLNELNIKNDSVLTSVESLIKKAIGGES